ncbi:hemerythrin HHE cation binding domain-containing protein [Daldinia caldariorum]|uniref:hemerythrin HHE cation binding domain-containing protein n=1 Tax=Daldinia caldariorum TaxID=326644 RepID=UPI0020075C8E|nr:hemerythrin HHE cation binding domain-containing protein [Daldinia caldariorum]KAI1466583.1 hemerythrin HHE cation binding domain-containing protein [Daldinia caldariorum]
MLRQSLRLARLKSVNAWQSSTSTASVAFVRPYPDTIVSSSLMGSKSHMTTDNRSPKDPNQTLSQADSISAVIRHDHRQIEKYFDKIINASDRDTQRRYQNAFVWELSRHTIAEELVVYPSIETGVNNGKEMAEKDRAEHQATKEALYKFQNMTPADKDFIPTLEALMKDLKVHIKKEEEHDLVKLEEALLPSRSKDLAEKFETRKSFTPTRSHPSTPNRPPYENVVGLMTAPFDKLRDMFRAWPDELGPRPPSGRPAR